MLKNYPMKEEKGSGKIRCIRIEIAENGFSYRAETDKMSDKEYVYNKVEDVLKAVKDDLTSPHLRTYKKKDKGLSTEAMRGKK